MLQLITSYIRIAASKIDEKQDVKALIQEMDKEYSTKVEPDSKPEHILALYRALKKIPAELVKACKIDSMGFEDLGPSKEFYPNHGKYIQGKLVINENILKDTKVERDNEGHTLTKFEQTYYHELGHGEDEKKQDEKDWMSLKKDWLELSGWSEKPKAGYKRLIIREEGSPEMKGEWYYSPKAKFTRFYAHRNPWDDFADHFSYYIGGLKSLVPPEKRKYFDEKLKKYYE
jgi:hypothetical protein